MEKIKPELTVVPYRNEIHLKVLNYIRGESLSSEPTGNIPDEMIAWRVIKRAPVTRANDNRPFTPAGVTDRIPRYVESRNNGDTVEMRWTWGFDWYVGFQLFAKDPDAQMQLEDWLVTQMLMLHPAMTMLGCDRFYYMGSGIEDELNYNAAMSNLPEHIWWFRTEEAFVTSAETLKTLFIEVGSSRQDEEYIQQMYNDYLDRELVKCANN